MDTLQIVGIALIALGLMDVPLGLLLVLPRVPPERRTMVQTVLAMGAFATVGLGLALFFGLFPV